MPNSSTKTCKDTDLARELSEKLYAYFFKCDPVKILTNGDVEEISRLLRTGTWADDLKVTYPLSGGKPFDLP